MPVKLLKSLLHLSWNNIVTAIFTYAITIALANYLGPKDFGIYNYILLISALLSIFVTYATDQTAQVSIAQTEYKHEIVSEILWIRGLNTIFITFLLVSYAFIAKEVVLYVLCLILSGFNLAFLYEYLSQNTRYSYIYMIERVVYVLLIAAMMTITHVSLTIIFLVYLATVLASIGYQMFDLSSELRQCKPPSLHKIIKILRNDFPLVTVSLSVFAYGGLSRIVLETKMGPESLGIFSLGWQITTFGTLFQAQICKVWRNKISRAVMAKDTVALANLVKTYFYFSFIPILVGVFVLFNVSEIIVSSLFDDSYRVLETLVPIFGIYLLVINLASLAEMLWIPINIHLHFMKINLVFGIMLIAILYFLPNTFSLHYYAIIITVVHLCATLFLLYQWRLHFINF